MFPAFQILVWTIKTMVFVVKTTVGVTQTLFAEAEPIFCASATGFSVMEKPVGEAPTIFATTQQVIQRRMAGLTNNPNIFQPEQSPSRSIFPSWHSNISRNYINSKETGKPESL
jgi:hypothetical protein